jgi:hypothetical protein
LPDAATGSDGAPPPVLTSWQIQLTGALDTTLDVQSYTVDLGTSASMMQSLHAAGRNVICYFSAGTSESFRPDASQFPASALGNTVQGYPNENWLDIRDATVRSVMQARLGVAQQMQCSGVHPSGLAAFQESTGLALTRADQLDYNRWLAMASHSLGLTIGLVDGDAALSQDLASDFDWTVVWSCLPSQCGSAAPFVAAGKGGFLVEYGDATRVADVCPQAKALGLSAIIKKNAQLDAFRVGCP